MDNYIKISGIDNNINKTLKLKINAVNEYYYPTNNFILKNDKENYLQIKKKILLSNILNFQIRYCIESFKIKIKCKYMLINILLKLNNIVIKNNIKNNFNIFKENYEKLNIFNKDNIYIDKINKKILIIKNKDFSIEEISKIKKWSKKYTINIILNISKDIINRYIKIPNFLITEIKYDTWKLLIKLNIDEIYINSNNNKIQKIRKDDIYSIKYKDQILDIFISDFIKKSIFKDLLKIFINSKKINNFIDNLQYLKSHKKTSNISANCDKSMYLLDNINRDFIKNLNINNYNNKIIAINSVAGSGKTTSLINITKKNKESKLLYTAFNKSLVEDMKLKKFKDKLENIFPYTFDAFMRHIYIKIYNIEPKIIDLKVNNIQEICVLLKEKNYYGFKKKVLTILNKFIEQSKYTNVKEFINNECDDKYINCIYVVENIWNNMLNHKFQTFNSIRKIVFHDNNSIKYINDNFDSILIDEAQDFDKLMLDFLLKTNMCKIFVGDDKQAIYDFRGSINSFKLLPIKNTLFIDFYSTFRISQYVCDYIINKIENLFIYSKSKNHTDIIQFQNVYKGYNYIYLCRKWKTILNLAQITPNIFIYDYDKKKKYIEKFYDDKYRKQISNINEYYEDDLPQFLLSLSRNEIKNLLINIENNLVSENQAIYRMSTIHSFKGLESDYVIIGNDIDKYKEQNLYYVALTRGKLLTIDLVQ